MSGFATGAIYDGLEQRLGDALRGVVCYDATTLDSVLRDDVAALHTDEERRAFEDTTIVHQLGQPDAERVFELGQLESVIRAFEKSGVVRVPLARSRNVAVCSRSSGAARSRWRRSTTVS